MSDNSAAVINVPSIYELTVKAADIEPNLTMPVWAWSRIRRAATHSGVFHADDVAASVLIRMAAYDHKVEFIRSRDPNELALADVIYDVGEGIYDHHGSSYGMDPCGIPFCGATRLWWAGLSEALIPNRYAQAWFYTHCLVPIALQDNGELIPKDFAHPLSWVHQMNPSWDEEPTFDNPEPFDAGFASAVSAAKPIMERLIAQARAVSRAQPLLDALPKDQEIVLIRAGIPDWADYVKRNTRAKFVIYSSSDTWMCQCVPEEFGDNNTKQVPFPSEWAGKRSTALEEVSGISGAVFCHKNAFLSGWTTREAAEDAARKVLKLRFQD